MSGNLTSDGSVMPSYDVENRLTQASGGKSVALSWDPIGRLASASIKCTVTVILHGVPLRKMADSCGLREFWGVLGTGGVGEFWGQHT